MNEKETVWVLPNHDIEQQASKLMAERQMPRHFAIMLALRGIGNFSQASDFVAPSLDNLRNPFLMKDMDKAVARLKKAMTSGESIMVLGDYDVDGVCGTALFVRIMTNLGIRVGYHVPDRFKEGYGVSKEAIDKSEKFGATLIVSIDSGITALDEIKYAASKKIDVIITDHHEPQVSLPEALAVLDPKRPDNTYPFRELAGVGVMFKLLQAIYMEMDLNMEELFEELDLVALGTAADVVPLVDENRILTRYGIERMKNTANTGLAALMEVAGAGKNRASSNSIIYSLAPRLNAPGRLSSASKTVELLISENWLKALKIAQEIEKENEIRRKMNDRVHQEAESMLMSSGDGALPNGIVLASDNWHQGVIGIAASRLVEKYYLPTVLISLEGTTGKGSARSIKEFDICGAMCECEDILENYGGHKYAVGLSIQLSKIEDFRKRFMSIINRELPDGLPAPSFTIDSEIDLSHINENLLAFLEKLSPFGEGNPVPLFLTRGLNLCNGSKIVGKNHLRFRVTDDRKSFDVIAYNMGDLLDRVRSGMPPVDILYNVEENEWMGRKNIQLVVKAMR